MNSNYLEEVISESTALIAAFEYEKARAILEEAFKANPSNIKIIDLISDVYFNVDNIEGACKMIKKSISLDPNHNPEKYMTFGQLVPDLKVSIQSYKKGIELFKKELKKENSNDKEIKKAIASGYASIAEKYMTTDLCLEKDAEDIVEDSIKEGFIYDENSIDLLCQLANVRIIRGRDKEAEIALNKIYDMIIEKEDNEDNTQERAENLPDKEIIKNVAKNYAEIQNYEKAIDVFELLISIDDLDLEAWYLLSYCNYQLSNYIDAYECLDKLSKSQKKVSQEEKDTIYKDVIESAIELYNAILSKLGNVPKIDDDNEDEEMQ